jgi:hypothetical protein
VYTVFTNFVYVMRKFELMVIVRYDSIDLLKLPKTHINSFPSFTYREITSLDIESKIIESIMHNLSAEHRPKFCSPSPAMVTSPYK